MALTSERLKELTRQRMDLIREIDKNPSDTNLQGRMSEVDGELSKERHTLIENDAMPSVSLPMAAAEEAPKKTAASNLKSKGHKSTKASNKNSESDSSKKLSEFF